VVLRADQTLAYQVVLKTIVEIQKAGVANVHLAYEVEKK
jgi:biopolymer transport protein ExbD